MTEQNIRADLKRFGGAGYVAVVNHGPYDHNEHDRPLPDEQFPRVFRALYEAVDYVEHGRLGLGRTTGPDPRFKIKIMRLELDEDGRVYSQVVWRNWMRSSGDPARKVSRRDLRRGRFVVMNRYGDLESLGLSEREAREKASRWSKDQRSTFQVVDRGERGYSTRVVAVYENGRRRS